MISKDLTYATNPRAPGRKVFRHHGNRSPWHSIPNVCLRDRRPPGAWTIQRLSLLQEGSYLASYG